MNKFTLGVVAGVSSLVIAVPIVVQVAGAASGSSASSKITMTKTVPSQACVQALVKKDDLFLANLDTVTAARKAATQAHKTALTAAAAITDDTQRQAAVQKAESDFRTAMQAVMVTKSTDAQTIMDAVKTACGKTMMGHDLYEMNDELDNGMEMGKGKMSGNIMERGRNGKHKGWTKSAAQTSSSTSSTVTK
ncbi:MAG: hypothetical protein JWM56_272 [Candidatus Peribacteria bacterium]|nr:hypothetical protein [Candidatus Peribacteria bacterium]